jgi:hypothetical protein
VPAAGTHFVTADESVAPMLPPGDVNALAREMNRLARNPRLRQQIGRRLHARVRQEYSLEHMAASIAAVYESILPAGPPDSSRAERLLPESAAAEDSLAAVRTPDPVKRAKRRSPRKLQVQSK